MLLIGGYSVAAVKGAWLGVSVPAILEATPVREAGYEAVRVALVGGLFLPLITVARFAPEGVVRRYAATALDIIGAVWMGLAVAGVGVVADWSGGTGPVAGQMLVWLVLSAVLAAPMQLVRPSHGRVRGRWLRTVFYFVVCIAVSAIVAAVTRGDSSAAALDTGTVLRVAVTLAGYLFVVMLVYVSAFRDFSQRVQNGDVFSLRETLDRITAVARRGTRKLAACFPKPDAWDRLRLPSFPWLLKLGGAVRRFVAWFQLGSIGRVGGATIAAVLALMLVFFPVFPLLALTVPLAVFVVAKFADGASSLGNGWWRLHEVWLRPSSVSLALCVGVFVAAAPALGSGWRPWSIVGVNPALRATLPTCAAQRDALLVVGPVGATANVVPLRALHGPGMRTPTGSTFDVDRGCPASAVPAAALGTAMPEAEVRLTAHPSIGMALTSVLFGDLGGVPTDWIAADS
ncbi:hypothetical protein [Patulibacter americanus]|uniref:hypothetical protein n=1 Tax=Patulibacter americanus TaxID=588672 RepID=UPI0003B37F5B|nr:hypothetical protein [Patulibacter americanus]